MLVVTGRSNLKYPTDRLDSETATVLINKGDQDLLWRPSSTWTKYALAKRRISLALRSSLLGRRSGFGLMDFPNSDFAAVDVHDQIQIPMLTSHC